MNTSPPLTIVRTFDAPKDRVFRAWTDAEEYRKWWGPKDFTCPKVTLDCRVGGKYHGAMQGPDGKFYWSTGTYKEIIPNEKIVCTDSFSDEMGNIIPASSVGMPGDWPLELTVTMTLEEHDGKTTMTLVHEGVPSEIQEDCRTSWGQSFDKMEKLVTSKQ